jgi:2-(1,2-epoxy-1,2-dihydrophenyl)acetyl-CoA isomerase
MKLIIYEKHKTHAVITFNRPDKGNTYNLHLVDEMIEAIEDAKQDDAVRVLVITGGKASAFCGGYDLYDFTPTTEEHSPLRWVFEEREGFHKLINKIVQFDKPIIASVNGPALAAGFTLALICDFRIVSEKAWFFDPSNYFGYASDEGLTHFLPRIVGLPKALEIIMLGQTVDAKEALELGMVTKVVPHEDLEKETNVLVKKLVSAGPIGQRLTKLSIYKNAESSLDVSLEWCSFTAQIANETKDAREGYNAWREKRPPVFTGK